jgi:hypothetical protein
MDYMGILKRAWRVTWRHKALWLFGFLLAPFGGGGGTGGGKGVQYTFGSGERMPTGVDLALVVLIAIVALFLVLVGIVLRYVSVGALVGMVPEAEDTGKTSVRSGWRIGGPRFLRLLGIDLLLGVPMAIVAIVAIGLGLAPLLLLFAKSDALTILAVALTVALILGVIGLLAVLGIAISVVSTMAHRQCVLECKGVMDSIRSGYALVRHNLRHVGLVWLMMLVIGLVCAAVVLPVGALFLGLAAAPATALYAATKSVAASMLIGFLLAIPGLAILSFLGGIYEAFQSAAWTITYRELPAR